MRKEFRFCRTYVGYDFSFSRNGVRIGVTGSRLIRSKVRLGFVMEEGGGMFELEER